MNNKAIFFTLFTLSLTALLLTSSSNWARDEKSLMIFKPEQVDVRKPAAIEHNRAPIRADMKDSVSSTGSGPVKLMGKSKIAFAARTSGSVSNIWLMNTDGSGKKRLTIGTSNNTHPTWSPDCSRIAFQSDRDGEWGIYVMDADGSNQYPLTLCGGGKEMGECGTWPGKQPAWSPTDSHRLVYVRDDAIYSTYGPGATNAQRIPTPPVAGYVHSPSWSPDGKRIAFSGGHDHKTGMFTAKRIGSDLIHLRNGVNYYSSTWTSDGKKIFFEQFYNNRRIYSMASDGSNVEALVGKPDILNDNTTYAPVYIGSGGHPTVSPNGKQIAFSGWYQDESWKGIIVANVDGSMARRLVKDAEAPAWSPRCFPY